MSIIQKIILFILSVAAISLNSCSYIFNCEHISFEYDLYTNPYMNILYLLNLNDIEQNELEVYAKVAIEYTCNSKCKYNNCNINGSIYNYNENKCIRAKLYENLIKEHGYYDSQITNTLCLGMNCIITICLLFSIITEYCYKNNIERNDLENSVA